MTRKEPRKAKIEPIHVEESAALKRLFETHQKMSQAAFGAEFGLGTQGNVWQYLNAKSPLNAAAAVKFAKGLGVEVREFSPRLAQEIENLSEGVTSEAGPEVAAWPFRRINEAKVRALDRQQQLLFEAAIISAAFDAGLDVLEPREPKQVVRPFGKHEKSVS